MIHLNATIFKNQITPRVTGTHLGLILWDEVRAYTNRIQLIFWRIEMFYENISQQ